MQIFYIIWNGLTLQQDICLTIVTGQFEFQTGNGFPATDLSWYYSEVSETPWNIPT